MGRHEDLRTAVVAALAGLDGDRAALDLIEDLPLLDSILGDVAADRVAAARAAGASWADVAARLGVSRQAAQQRFGRDRPRRRGVHLELRLEPGGRRMRTDD